MTESSPSEIKRLMLHTLMHSPWQSDIAGRISLLSEDDDVLLLQDGVLAALEGNPFAKMLLQSPATIYVLEEDLLARGLTEQISANMCKVGYNGFVELTIRHPQQLVW
ncbi:TusB family tRNA 5-methylaminomethyl-2-thiouridine synthase [Tatumella ptyseos ATCC 33301]|uniref:Protein TusB n=2 Tax=Tatumella ptyseos TaxID=82987 RepID=A0A085JP17_9GAMM|nr:TusB family tRNA 5-methylaminomethyl-2-thiouridine synthase [Tatumella ptyseos ATCC 33301]